MKFKIRVYPVLFLLLFACNQGKKTETSHSKEAKDSTDVTKKETILEVDSNELALQPENFRKLFALMHGEPVELNVDSTITNEYILVKYGVYKIYHFKSDTLATGFYNELLTQELVLPFGINKRPKNIFLNGDKIIYMHLENSNGHNYKKYIEQFNSVIKLDRSAGNLDSIIGGRQCSRSDYKAKTSQLAGIYEARFIHYIFKKDAFRPYINVDTTTLFETENTTVKIEKNRLVIGDKHFEISEEYHRMELPDAYLFMKYAYLMNYWDPEMENNGISEEVSSKMVAFCNGFQKKRQKITIHYLSGNPYWDFTLFFLEKGNAYIQIANRLYLLKKK